MGGLVSGGAFHRRRRRRDDRDGDGGGAAVWGAALSGGGQEGATPLEELKWICRRKKDWRMHLKKDGLIDTKKMG